MQAAGCKVELFPVRCILLDTMKLRTTDLGYTDGLFGKPLIRTAYIRGSLAF